MPVIGLDTKSPPQILFSFYLISIYYLPYEIVYTPKVVSNFYILIINFYIKLELSAL